ncbi:MAG: sigma-70 family RNA polymerase sigma factor, partial [Actinomycetota bacterium]|nr:sigma-70 family RNA polymerase sigma factor [Actinomycetota bacterium]
MSQTRQSADDQRLAAERELFERLHDADASDAERSAVRDELIETHMPLVHHLARRYADRGEPIEDVTQVATIGLIQAIDKFDPERGSAFSTYAVPTILGAIRRHFRDATWSVKVPRRVQELRGKIDAAHDALAQELGRSPTVAEIAARAHVDPADVLDSLELSRARSTAPIDATADGE